MSRRREHLLFRDRQLRERRLPDLRLSDRVLVLRAGAVVAEHQAGWSDGDLVADIEGVELS